MFNFLQFGSRQVNLSHNIRSKFTFFIRIYLPSKMRIFFRSKPFFRKIRLARIVQVAQDRIVQVGQDRLVQFSQTRLVQLRQVSFIRLGQLGEVIFRRNGLLISQERYLKERPRQLSSTFFTCLFEMVTRSEVLNNSTPSPDRLAIGMLISRH